MGYRLAGREVLLPRPGLGFGDHTLHDCLPPAHDAPHAEPDEIKSSDAEVPTEGEGNSGTMAR